MTAALLFALRSVDVVSLPGIAARALALGGLIAGGGAVYFLALILLGSQEVRLLASVARPAR
jgi:hypothetical protein